MCRIGMIYKLLIFVVIATMISCSNTPKGLLSEKKMAAVIIDMQNAEEMINNEPTVFSAKEDREQLYASIFRKHGVTEADYDSSLVWYGQHLTEYMRVQKMALTEIQARIEAMGNVTPVAVDSNSDSIDIWIYRRYYELSPKLLSNLVIFDIKPLAAYSSGSSFVFGMNVWGVQPQMTENVEVHICAVSDDSTYMASRTIKEDGYYETSLKTSPAKRTQHIYGYIRIDGKEKAYNTIYIDSFSLMKYRYSISGN